MLLLAAGPWLLSHGVTTGALVGALAYVTQSLLPALRNLIHGLGTSGSRLTVVLRRLAGGDGHRHTAPAARTAAPRYQAFRAPTRPPAPRPRRALSLSSVTFAYGPASAPVVRDLDLTLPPGAHLAVVGPSGAGKSTLTALVAGLLTPSHGTIRVRWTPRARPGGRRRAGAHPAGGVRLQRHPGREPRVSAARPGAPAELLAAAEAVGLTPLAGRSGGRTPGSIRRRCPPGERQLVALTRAYLSYAPLALLDEATCHLDPGTEERAERAFAARPGGTLVVVAHRISSARRAGRVLVMDGRNTAYGDHEELVRSSALLPGTRRWLDSRYRPGAVRASPGPGRCGSRRCGCGPRSCG